MKEKGERRKEKGERRKEKGERRKEKGERIKDKGERMKDGGMENFFVCLGRYKMNFRWFLLPLHECIISVCVCE